MRICNLKQIWGSPEQIGLSKTGHFTVSTLCLQKPLILENILDIASWEMHGEQIMANT
jgi:hypothetical protein